MLALKDNKIYEILKKRKGHWTEYYASYILPLEHDMTSILENIKNMFPHFPDHGIQHSIRILDFIGSILSTKLQKELTALDLVVLIFAALFHDSGMALFNASDVDKEVIRKEHPKKAKEVIEAYFDKCLQGMTDKDRIREAVIFVCEAHGMTIDELTNDKRFSTEDTVNMLTIHYGILAFLLRIGDLMDLEADRVNNFRMMMFCDNFYELSKSHNERHLKVKTYAHTPNKLEITVVAEDITQYMIWDDWFTYLIKDIEKFNALYAQYGFFLPNPKTCINTLGGAPFIVERLRFEIDDKGGMWNIISKSVYTNELDFVRELIQNAIDASLKPVYLDAKIELEHISPRTWGEKAKGVYVCYSEKENTLCVVDNGIGMNISDLKNYLFKVSSTGKVLSNKRKFEFPGIAQFGIGFISCLVNAESIYIYTSKDGKKLHRVTMENDRNYAFIETQNDEDKYLGTTVVLKLRQKIAFAKIWDYVQKTFGFPSVKITVVNTDVLLETILKDNDNESAKALNEKPYNLDEILQKGISIRSAYIQKLKQYRKSLMNILIEYDSLYNYYKTGLYSRQNLFHTDYDENININEWELTIDSTKKIASELKSLLLSSELPGMNEYVDISKLQKPSERYNRYIFESLFYYLTKKIEEMPLLVQEVGETVFDELKDYEYYIITIDSKLKVEDIIQTREPVSLKDETGLVLIKHKNCDYDTGIEYIATNGFVFYKGKIYDKLVKITRTYNMNYIDKSFESYVFGANGYANTMKALVDEHLSEQRKEVTSSEDYKDIKETANTVKNSRPFDNRYTEIRMSNGTTSRHTEFIMRKYLETIHNDITQIGKDDSKVEQLKLEQAKYAIREVTSNNLPAFYQDGIGINDTMNDLFPMGFFKIVCNCTADARMKLNISRHAQSEIYTDVAQWVEVTGNKIQHMIMQALEKAWKDLDLQIDYVDIYHDKFPHTASNFKEAASQNLLGVLKEMGKWRDLGGSIDDDIEDFDEDDVFDRTYLANLGYSIHIDEDEDEVEVVEEEDDDEIW